jgi:predicted SnoaL-like aldol condensation-catalyzing enzyme
MSVEGQSVPDSGKSQAELDGAATWLGEQLDVGLTPDEVIQAVRSAAQVKENKQVLLQFQREVFNASDWSLENLRAHLTEDFVDHAAMVGDPPGFEGVQMRFSAWASAFEDADEENIEMVGENDILAVLYDLHAKHTGNFLGVEPTNREVVIPGIEFVRIRDGKIAEHWGIYDFLTTAEEIGADVTFHPRQDPGQPARPEVPWRRQIREDEGPAAAAAAEAVANQPRADGDAGAEVGESEQVQ